MTTAWTELKTGKEVFDRQAEGWEIEYKTYRDEWCRWIGSVWDSSITYQGRPAQSKPKIVTSECWRNTKYGSLAWADPEQGDFGDGWERVPSWDFKDGEVKV
jgi:hypothetical protein